MAAMAVAGRTLTRPDVALPAEAWLIAGLLAAVGFAVGALFGHPAVMTCGAVGCVVAALAFYEPRLVGPLLALALPLEISKLPFTSRQRSCIPRIGSVWRAR